MLEKVKVKLMEVKAKGNGRVALLAAAPVVAVAATVVPAFATETPLPTIAITTEMLTPLVEGVIANIGVMLPVGIGLFAIFLGIRILPSLLSRFIHM